MGLEAKAFLTRRLADGEPSGLKVKTKKDGKYGRMLGTIFVGSQNINEEMVYRGFAWEYDGGTKKKDLEELKSRR